MLYFWQMSAITLKVPDELAERLRSQQERLPEILELGLRELNAETQSGFEGAAQGWSSWPASQARKRF